MSSELSEVIYDYIRAARGGCRCQDPGAYPPCGNCTREETLDEVEEAIEMCAGQDGPDRKLSDSEVTSALRWLAEGGMPKHKFLSLQAWLIDEHDYEAKL